MGKDSPTRLLSRYQQLIEISRELAPTFDLNILLQKITNASAQISRAEGAILLLWDDTKKKLTFEAATPGMEFEKIKGTISPDDSFAGWVARHQLALAIDDVKKDKRRKYLYDKRTGFLTKSIIAIPLMAKDRFIGVLELVNKLGGPFTGYDKETLQALGAQAAIAIENARLFQQADLIAELVHELRTPLASISTIAHLLQRTEVPDNQKLELSQTIIQETNRLNELATSFLDIARMEARKSAFILVECNINALIRECYRIIQPRAAERNLVINLDLMEEIINIEIDRDKMKQVLLNLLTNAVKYNAQNGTVLIKTDRRWDELIITIQDTGIGIAPEELPLLFNRFYRSKATEQEIQDTGLGLYVSKQIIENHGGRIEVQSQVGGGSTFTITLNAAVS